MFTLLTDIGKTKLENLGGNKLTFTKYSVGLFTDTLTDLHGIPPGSTFSSAALTSSYTEHFVGSSTGIDYQLPNNENTILRCFVPPNYTYFKLNMNVLYATLNGEEFPLLVSYALETNPKFSSIQNKYGIRYFFMLQLHLVNRENRFDFSNLHVEKPEFSYYEYNYTTPNAVKDQHDQLIINKHVNTPEDYAIFAVESEGQHYGILAQPWNLDEQVQEIQLGEEGDIEIDGKTLIFSINSHNNQVILNNTEFDYWFLIDDVCFVIFNDYHLVKFDDDWVIFNPDTSNPYLLTTIVSGQDTLLTLNLEGLQHLLTIDNTFNPNEN